MIAVLAVSDICFADFTHLLRSHRLLTDSSGFKLIVIVISNWIDLLEFLQIFYGQIDILENLTANKNLKILNPKRQLFPRSEFMPQKKHEEFRQQITSSKAAPLTKH